ncbi:DUF6262 family protein [Ktedonobacter sp. SOSP1-85]|uniref:DUF6262 family protein n=1 Tax=Ktedonobacter sp. SOSP1-85 TaxID=2778367 RepID=UPI0019154F0D|nr:DUF6262 family protein [Ktedonobacter sp. SOSP1-85]
MERSNQRENCRLTPTTLSKPRLLFCSAPFSPQKLFYFFVKLTTPHGLAAGERTSGPGFGAFLSCSLLPLHKIRHGVTNTEQCRKNAQAKSQQKRQTALAAIQALQQEKHPVTRSAVARRAGVSVVFLRNHPDLLQAIEEAEQRHRLAPPESAASSAKDQVIAALRRRLEELKQTVAAKDEELRLKQREIDVLYGKLAAPRAQ